MTPKRVLVAGGSSGIGAAIAEGLISAGHSVGIVSRRPLESWDWSVPPNWNALDNLLSADLRNPELLQAVCSAWAGATLDALVFSAVDYGGSRRQPILDTGLPSWQTVIDTNVLGFAALLSAVLPALLRAASGILINVSSETASNPAPGRAPYGMSKAAQRHILRSLAEEIVSPNGLSIVEVLPEGMVRTPGIERRRPATMDWSSYASPRSLSRFVCELIQSHTRIPGYHAFVLNPHGEARSSNGEDVVSQSSAQVSDAARDRSS